MITTTKIIYENCQCLNTDNSHMFYCTRKKANSYLKKGLAKLISSEPFVFKLLFEPKGRGYPNQQPRVNECVVCNSPDDLTKHHVIPYALRKFLSSNLKDHLSEDIVPLCENHHREYENSSRSLLLTLLENCKEEIELREKIRRSKKAKCNLTYHLVNLSEEKISEFTKLLPYFDLPIKSDFELLLEKFTERELYDMWRNDFLKWMKNYNIDFKFVK